MPRPHRYSVIPLVIADHVEPELNISRTTKTKTRWDDLHMEADSKQQTSETEAGSDSMLDEHYEGFPKMFDC